ncbi:MAG: HlyD family efflux transporter periplasmic adaptor subunit, partial [Cyanobacteria bacterium]|nr:HlyD family efflux transporter periplasmic adaptor subunit [Cyanobacteriota bacterium]
STAQELSLLTLSKVRIQAQLAGKPFPSKESIKTYFQGLSEMPGLVLDETAYLNQASLYQSSQQGFQEKIKGYEETMARFNAQAHGNRVEQQQTSSLLKTAVARKNRLTNVRDIITQDDFEKAQADVQGGENKLKTLGFEHQSLMAQSHQVLQEKRFTEENYRSELLKELAENQKQTAGLTAKLKTTGFLNHHQEMVAPVSGVVSELMVHTVGGVVTPAQKLMLLVPDNTPLQFQATVQNKDIGFVKPGTHGLVKVDTFDFQKYGMLTGKVVQVAPDSHEDSKLGPIYKIALIPNDASMGWHWQKDRNNGLSIVSGMTGTAEIKIGQRRIIDFLLYPMLRNWEEGMQVR